VRNIITQLHLKKSKFTLHRTLLGLWIILSDYATFRLMYR